MPCKTKEKAQKKSDAKKIMNAVPYAKNSSSSLPIKRGNVSRTSDKLSTEFVQPPHRHLPSSPGLDLFSLSHTDLPLHSLQFFDHHFLPLLAVHLLDVVLQVPAAVETLLVTLAVAVRTPVSLRCCSVLFLKMAIQTAGPRKTGQISARCVGAPVWASVFISVTSDSDTC